MTPMTHARDENRTRRSAKDSMRRTMNPFASFDLHGRMYERDFYGNAGFCGPDIEQFT